tara:strand:- start:59 stop:922 length:864 start_codon:yes stop_codon:yes gene_type:complete
MKILSFDIEDWFNLLEHPSTDDINNWSKFDSRVKKSTDAILEVLNEYNISASFFILGWVAENQPEVVKKIHDSGHHIGTHSYAHKVAYSQSREEFEKDLKKSISLLEDLIGKKIDSYRAPGFSITAQNMWAYEVLHENGIIYDSSIFPSARYHGGFKNFPTKKPFKLNVNGETIYSFPLNTKSFLNFEFVYSGGGYFRLLPKNIINKFLKEDDYVMTYFHPRDFDFEQPVMDNLSLFRRFKSYYGIKGAMDKLKYVLSENHFISMMQAHKTIDWSKSKTLELQDFLN